MKNHLFDRWLAPSRWARRQLRLAPLLAVLLLSIATIAQAQDAIPPASITVEGGAADVLGWPVTSTVTSFHVRPGTLHITYTKQGQWPGVDIGGGTLQEATVWIFLQLNGRWYGTGAERLRPNQIDKPEGADVARLIAADWLYDRNRWPQMAGHVLSDGEIVGVMVAAGSTRSDHNAAVQERTGIVLARFSNGTIDLYRPPDPTPAPQPTPPTDPTPPPAPEPGPQPATDAAVVQRLDTIIANQQKEIDALNALRQGVTDSVKQLGDSLKSALPWLGVLMGKPQ